MESMRYERGGEQVIKLICSNCEYEVKYLTAEEGLCEICLRAYERGRESK